MKKSILITIFILLATITFAQLKVQNLLVENRSNPIGVDITKPMFSWQLVSEKRNTSQSAYEIRVSPSRATLDKGTIWKSGKITSDQSTFVKFDGSWLDSGMKYFWQVRVWDQNGAVSAWSEPSFWQMGLLNTGDWKAKWIQVGYKEDTINRPSPLFRKEFKTSKKIASATAYITAHGLYEASINGKRVGDAYLTPGWTSYSKRLQYQQYDVTSLLAEGNNAVGVMLGSGWYRGFIAWGGQKNFYGKDLGLLFQLEIRYADGTSETVISDQTWKSSTGSVVNSEIYNGETVDSRKEQAGWDTPIVSMFEKVHRFLRTLVGRTIKVTLKQKTYAREN